jgi:two-component system response regulator HydG
VNKETIPAPDELPAQTRRREPGLTTALAVIWSVDEPERIGELVLLPADGRTGILGRGGPPGEQDGPVRLHLIRQRPGENQATPPLAGQHISREQLQIGPGAKNGLAVRRIGQCLMSVNGEACDEAELDIGDVLELKNQLMFVCVRRPRSVEAVAGVASGPFGEADDHGIVGESAATWALRIAIARLSRRSAHVLVHGPSGSGKELVAQAIHSARDDAGPLVSRNAATLPEALVDAELFGNLRNYPNPGMSERSGLVGEANGGVLFLDEIGELPTSAQAHLLRVLDMGEYQRLGESRTRRSRFRLIAATNRDPGELKSDLSARMKLRVAVQGLNARIEDIPLLARHLLRAMCHEDPSIAERFFHEEDPNGHPRLTPALARSLTQHRWTTNVRELESVLWDAVDRCRGSYLDGAVRSTGRAATSEDVDISVEALRAALERHKGVREKAWRDLGLKNRHALTRLMRKHGLN